METRKPDGDNLKLSLEIRLKTVPEDECRECAASIICSILEDTPMRSVSSHAIKGRFGNQFLVLAVLHDHLNWAVIEVDTVDEASKIAEDFSNYCQGKVGGEINTSVWVSPDLN